MGVKVHSLITKIKCITYYFRRSLNELFFKKYDKKRRKNTRKQSLTDIKSPTSTFHFSFFENTWTGPYLIRQWSLKLNPMDYLQYRKVARQHFFVAQPKYPFKKSAFLLRQGDLLPPAILHCCRQPLPSHPNVILNFCGSGSGEGNGGGRGSGGGGGCHGQWPWLWHWRW